MLLFFLLYDIHFKHFGLRLCALLDEFFFVFLRPEIMSRFIAFDEGERILILPLLAGSGLMLSCFETFRTGKRLKMPRLHATVVSC